MNRLRLPNRHKIPTSFLGLAGIVHEKYKRQGVKFDLKQNTLFVKDIEEELSRQLGIGNDVKIEKVGILYHYIQSGDFTINWANLKNAAHIGQIAGIYASRNGEPLSVNRRIIKFARKKNYVIRNVLV